jgi:hypothetical protein
MTDLEHLAAIMAKMKTKMETNQERMDGSQDRGQ